MSLPLLAQDVAALEGHFSTDKPLELDGHAETSGQGGFLVSGTDEIDIQLTAPELSVLIEYEQGDQAGQPFPVAVISEQGRDRHAFTNATLTLDAWGPSTQIFAQPRDEAALQATGHGETQQRVLNEGDRLARGGYSDQTVGGGTPPSYNYRAEQPLLAHENLDELHLEGAFTLFVKNATLHIQHGNDSWTNWTGYREQSTTPATESYEMRVTTLTAETGTLSVDAPNHVDAIAPQLHTNLTGSLSNAQAEGILSTAKGTVNLQEDAISLQGDGLLETSILERESNPRIGAWTLGDYAIVDQSIATTQPSPNASTTLPYWLAAGLLTVALVLAATARRYPATLRILPAPLRERLYRRLRRQGLKHENDRAWTDAARTYGRMATLYPKRPLGWYGRSLCLLEDEDPEAALTTLDEANHHLDELPLDLVELEVAAAWDAQQEERAQRALETLSQRSSSMAKGLVRDLSLEPLARSAGLDELIGPETGGGSIDGYV